MEKKENKGIIIALCIVIIILTGTITYLFINTPKKNEEHKNEVDTLGKEEINIYTSEVQDLYEVLLCDNETFSDLYMEDSYTNKSLKDEVKVKMFICNVVLEEITIIPDQEESSVDKESMDGVYAISEDVVLDEINEMFGKDNGYKHITKPVSFLGVKLVYNEKTRKYEYYGYDENIPAVISNEIFSKLVQAYKDETSIILVEKMYMYDYNKQEVYKDIYGKKLISKDKSNDFDDKDNYFEQGSTITYTFKLDENNNYYFYSSKISY